MTPAEALLSVRSQLNETTAAFWTDAEIYGYLSEGERLLAGRIGGVQVVTAATTVTDTSAYARPTGCLRIDRVTYDGKKLRKGTYRDRDYLDATNYGSTIKTGPPVMYIEWAAQIILYPVPQSAVALGTFFRKTPTRITAGLGAFTIQEETIQEMLPDYAIWKASLKDQELARADRHKQAWDAHVLDATALWQDREHQDAVYSVKDEDEYPGESLGMD